ncbi:uncharacterized protein LOC131006397 [Salvia miltiorrhiza]|uniref:uncharacterized protein LOC131006397 n=1 Tax=Salvia miltiorrhiza TaxID=226208 RepID=UPI0025AD3729|nr:uncharacterized protein LOC131006397 [Salvia miltiorrhiza]
MRKDLTTTQRNQVVQFILQGSINGKAQYGRLEEARQKFCTSRSTIARLWRSAKQQHEEGEVINSVSRKITTKRRTKVHLDLSILSNLEYTKRGTIRRLAVGLEISRSTIGFLKKIKFRDMHNTVHIDEKWFYITRGSHRPLIADDGTVLFDGKIGIFPFTIQVPAKRNSRNRQAGTLETKAIESITNEVIKDCLINKIIPAIMAKWPEGASKDIFIQQDNARPHILDSDPDFRKAASQRGFNIRLTQQPPNSPDCNVNDLGWFRAIQSLQHETACKTVDELLQAVVDSFEKLSPHTLNNVFLSLQGCMMEIMKFKGHNCYKIPHMGKEALRRSNQLPQNLEVPVELIQGCIDYLNEMGSQDGITEIVQSLGLDEIEGY